MNTYNPTTPSPPNAPQAETVLRPMRLGQLLDKSLKLTPKIFGSLILAYCILAVLQLSTQAATNVLVTGEGFLVFALLLLAQISFSMVLFFVVVMFTADMWRGRASSPKQAFSRISVSIVLRTITLTLRVSIVSMLGLLLFIIPGLIYLVNRWLAAYILMIEDTSVSYALQQSKSLMTQGKWYRSDSPVMRVTGIGIVLIILYAIFMLAAGGIDYQSLSDVGANPFTIYNFLIFIGSYAIGVFANVCLVGFYFDLKARYEGSDILSSLDKFSNT